MILPIPLLDLYTPFWGEQNGHLSQYLVPGMLKQLLYTVAK